MSDIILKNLGKMYKLYRRPADKVLDAFGLMSFQFWRKNYFQEFWALRDLNLVVKKGERLGIIGRNGAGKSTLLKIITGNISPTEGEVLVRGRIQALMELGTGFHPEFTGRENIRASLAYQGFPSKIIREMEEEIIDFAELEAFIDQPIKTYSAGMYARLAFSTATSVQPEILIIDEVLGAGDAYFAGKCVERMKRLTGECGATVLFVSHDLGSVQQMCERVIWIDRGRIVQDGSPLEVTKAYYASILQQEEIRLKARNARLGKRQAGEVLKQESTTQTHELVGRFLTRSDTHPLLSHPVKSVALSDGKDFSLVIEPGSPMDNDRSQPAHLLTDSLYMNWSAPKLIEGKRVRCFENMGGKYFHAPFIFNVPLEVWRNNGLKLILEHQAKEGELVYIELYDGKKYRQLGRLSSSPDTWLHQTWPVPEFSASAEDKDIAIDTQQSGISPLLEESRELSFSGQPESDPNVNKSGQTLKQRGRDKFYTDYAEFAEIHLWGIKSNPQVIFERGESFSLTSLIEIRKRIPICGYTVSMYTLTGVVISSLFWPAEGGLSPGMHEWTVRIENPMLRQGEYVVSCALIQEFPKLTNENVVFYASWNRVLSFRVEEGFITNVPMGLVFFQTVPASGMALSYEKPGAQRNGLSQPLEKKEEAPLYPSSEAQQIQTASQEKNKSGLEKHKQADFFLKRQYDMLKEKMKLQKMDLEKKEFQREIAEKAYQDLQKEYQFVLRHEMSKIRIRKQLLLIIKDIIKTVSETIRYRLCGPAYLFPKTEFTGAWKPFDPAIEKNSTKTKILILSHMFPHPEQPGSGSFIFEQVKALRQDTGLDARVVVGRPYWFVRRINPVYFLRQWLHFYEVLSKPEWLEFDGVPVLYLPYPILLGFWTHGWSYQYSFRKKIEEIQKFFPFDLVHAHTGYLDGSAGLEISRRYNVPFLVTEHTGPFSGLMENKIVKRTTLKNLTSVKTVVVVSKAQQQAVSDYLSAKEKSRIRVLPNGVDTDLFYPPLEWKPDGKLIRILFVGYYVPVKNIPLLLDAFKLVLNEIPEAKLQMIGGGENDQQEQALFEKIIDMEISANVEICGFKPRQEIARIMREECDLLVLSSESETFGCVVIEAMATGKPVVSTRCGGPEDIITGPHLGELCANHNPKALAEAILKVSGRINEYSSVKIREYAVNCYSYQSLSERLCCLYREVLKK